MDIITKHPTEEFYIAGSIRLNQQTGEGITLANSSASAYDKDGNDVSDTLLEQSSLRVMTDPDSASGVTNNALAIRLVGGTEAASPYLVEFVMDTDMNHVWVSTVKVKVKDPKQ